jgi:hypothetical protein
MFALVPRLGLDCIAAREGPGASSPLAVRAWWAVSSTALRDLERATEFSVNALIIENETDGPWYDSVNGLCLYDFSDRFQRRSRPERERVEARRSVYRSITEATRKRGIACYLMAPEIVPPEGYGGLTFEDAELWELIPARLREVFRALPDLDGFMLYLCEGRAEIFTIPGGEKSLTARAHRLISTVWETCRAERRKLLVTTFIHRLERLEAIAEALRSLPPHPDLAVLQYCCPNDWGLYELVNPSLGRVGPHPEILGFDYAAENWGQGVHPFVHVEFMADRLREARRRSDRIAGLAGYVSWYGRSVLGTFDEANVYAGKALAETLDRDGSEILQAWCMNRFGEGAADVAAACLARTHPAIFKAQHLFGYWLDTSNKSGLPSLRELDEYFIGDYYGEALAKWDPQHAATWEKIQKPDEEFLREILGEKEEAVSLCNRSLREIERSRERFRLEDFGALERAFRFQEVWARLWRELVHAFFLRQIARREGWTSDRRGRLERVLDLMSREADELESAFGRDVFPYGPERAREFVTALRREVGST